MAFDFPPAQDGLRVTNPESGVTYVYREKYQSWIIEAVDNKAVRVFTECCTPCDAAQGDIWFNPCTNCLHFFHDGAWEPVIDCETSAGTYKGEKQFASELPTTGNENGDAWIVLEEAAIYVWSSNGWVRADHTDTKELRDLIQQEEDERKAADQLLAGQIGREAVKRKAEDDKLWEALEEETEARKSGDQAVTDLLNDCCTKAEDGLKDLEDALADEVNSREDADKALQDQIDANGKELEFANDRIDQEINDRIAGDDQLRDDISDEASQREAADEQLLALVREKECKWMGEVQSVSDLPSTRYDWTPLVHFKPHTVYSIAWGPDHYIAGSSNGHVWSSDDGQFWERRNVGIAYNSNVLATFYANGVWLIGGEGGLVSRSVDGITWSNHYSTTTSNVQDFAYGANTYVYVTDGGVVATSSDGVSWTKQDQTIRWGVHGIDSILSVTYSEGLAKFVACTARGMILISDTGVGWDLIDPGLMGDGKILTIAATEWNGKSLLVAGGDFAKRLLYSEDAINWVTAPKNYFGDAFPTDLKDTGTVLLAALSDGRAGFASDDRVSSWTFESTGAGERLLAIEHAPQNSNIALSEGNWVVAGNFGQAFVRLPGNGLESGDTWAVRDEMALYTWSSLGWITAGSGGGSGPAMQACPDGGLQVVGSDADACMSIKTEADSALVLDGGVLKIDSTKLKVTSDNVLPAGTDPGLVSSVPVFTDPEGNTWSSQSDYNKWLYEDQQRQDAALENLDLSEYVTQEELEKDQQRQDTALILSQQKQDEEFADDQKRQDDELEAYKKEVESDQKRQDDELEDHKKEVVLSQQRQDAEFKDDQERQDEQIEELRRLVACKGVTSEIQRSLSSTNKYGISMGLAGDVTQVHVIGGDIDPTKTWLNIEGVKYEADKPPNDQSKPNDGWWMIPVDKYGSLLDLYPYGTEVTIHNCEGQEEYVTQEEFEKDQQRQEDELNAKIDAIETGGNYLGDAPPEDPNTPRGALFIDEKTLKMYVYDGSAWIQIGGGG